VALPSSSTTIDAKVRPSKQQDACVNYNATSQIAETNMLRLHSLTACDKGTTVE